MSRSFLKRGWGSLRRSCRKLLFDRVAAGVLDTAPLPVSGNAPIFLSQVCHRDVTAYLLAIKSLYLGLGGGQVLVINDGSLTAEDMAVLRRHIPGLDVMDIASIDTGRCPRGGTWERLVKIIELSSDHYVIQADADTLVSGPIPEVVQCWRDNKSFLLGTDVGQDIVPASDFAQIAHGWVERWKDSGLKIGTLAEAALDELADGQGRFYAHGSSGFAGFAKGAFRMRDLEIFSDGMRMKLGKRWDEWGSEQISSNYMLANAPGAVVLPFGRYACFEPGVSPAGRPFMHFIGSNRFEGGHYRRLVRQFLAGLQGRSR